MAHDKIYIPRWPSSPVGGGVQPGFKGGGFGGDVQLYSISGTITGDVVEGVTITLTGDASDSTTTDENGDYSFTGLLDGDYNVEPSLDGYTFTPTDIDVTISGADDDDSDFVSAQSLPLVFEWSDGTTPDFSGSEWDRAEGPDTHNPAQATITNVDRFIAVWTPPYEKSIQIVLGDGGTGSQYHCVGQDGIPQFDKANGMRVMIVCRNLSEEELVAEVGFGAVGSTIDEYGYSPYKIRCSYRADQNPDAWYIDINDGTFQRIYDGTAGVQTDSSNRWYAIGLEVPKNMTGNLKVRVVPDGSTAYEQTVAIAGSWGSIEFDKVFWTHGEAAGDNDLFQVNMLWVGTVDDDWPV